MASVMARGEEIHVDICKIIFPTEVLFLWGVYFGRALKSAMCKMIFVTRIGSCESSFLHSNSIGSNTHLWVYKGVPKKGINRVLLEPQCTGSSRHPLCMKILFFWSFLTKTKQDQVLLTHINGEIWPLQYSIF